MKALLIDNSGYKQEIEICPNLMTVTIIVQKTRPNIYQPYEGEAIKNKQGYESIDFRYVGKHPDGTAIYRPIEEFNG